MRAILTLIIFAVSIPLAIAQQAEYQRPQEAELSKHWCDEAGGISEYRLPDNTRVDCLLDEYAVEMDWSHKWAECIGQAQYYGVMSNRRPACVLIKKSSVSGSIFKQHNRRASVAANKYTLILCISERGTEIHCDNNRGQR